jgi:hypothetical protein
MGIVSGRKLEDFIKSGWFAVVLLLRFLYKWLYRCGSESILTDSIGNRFIFAILAASASYIAVPAALK